MEIQLSGSQSPTNVIVVIGAGWIGQAIARRVSAGKHVLLANLRQENTDAAAKTLSEAGFNVTTAKVDVSSRASHGWRSNGGLLVRRTCAKVKVRKRPRAEGQKVNRRDAEAQSKSIWVFRCKEFSAIQKEVRLQRRSQTQLANSV